MNPRNRTMEATRQNPTRLALACALAALLATPAVYAASDAWNVDASDNWVTTANWLSGAQVPGSTTTDNADVARFSFPLGANRTVTVDSPRYIGGIDFGNSSAFGYTLGSGTVNLNDGGVIQTLETNGDHIDKITARFSARGATATFTANATSPNSTLEIGSTSSSAIVGSTNVDTVLTLNGINTGLNKLGGNVSSSSTSTIISGGSGHKLSIIKDGPGTWWMGGKNVSNGGLTIKAGTLVFGGGRSDVLGSGSVTLGDSAGGANAATLLSAASGLTISRPITLAGATTGTLTLGGGTGVAATTYSGGVTGPHNLTLESRGTLLTMSSKAINHAGTLAVKGAGDTAISFAIGSNVTDLTKDDAGTLTLSGANSYTGTTTVNGGTLALGVSGALPASTAVSLGAAATLDAVTFVNYAGTLNVAGSNAAINLGDGCQLAFADSSALPWAGTLNITGHFIPGSSLRFGTTGSGLTPAQLSQITSVVGQASFSLDNNGYLTLSHTTAPTVVSIVDNKVGGPVPVSTLVTYNVTFSHAMNGSTVDASDFISAGTATYYINAVTASSSTNFAVQVMPTSGGTLRLQIPAGASLTDALSTPLDTTSAIADDTTIIVNSTPAPTLVDIFDDKAAQPVPTNTLVTYTVIFSTDMDQTTVTTNVFGNAGTAAVVFGTITKISPGVFTVQVTPMTSGTLRLQVNAGAVLRDSTTGNMMDTTSAIADNTTLFAYVVAAWNVDNGGNWIDDTNWNPVLVPGSTNTDSVDLATFSFPLGTNCTVRVDTTRSIGGIDFGNSSAFGYTLSSGTLNLYDGGVIQTLAGNGDHIDRITSHFSASGATATFTANATSPNSTMEIGSDSSSAIVGSTNVDTVLTLNGSNPGPNRIGADTSGSNTIFRDGAGHKLALVKDGPGTWWIGGKNLSSGGLTIKAGTLIYGGGRSDVLGSGPVTLGDYASGTTAATLLSAASGLTISRPITLAGTMTGTLTLGGGAGVAATTYSGGVTGPNNLTLDSRGTLLTMSSQPINHAGTLTVKGPGDTVISSGIGVNVTDLTKNDAGTLTLSGANNYTGTTTVNGGTLAVMGNIAGPVTVQSGGTLSLGASVGSLSIYNSLALAGTVLVKVDNSSAPANDVLTVSGTLTYGGTLAVTNIGGAVAAGSQFKVFNDGGTGNFTTILGSPGPGLVWAFTPATGTLRAVARPTLVVTPSGGNALSVSWEDPQSGFKLQSQTNGLSVGLSTNWSDYPGGATSPVNVTIDPANPMIFFRLITQ